MAELEMRREKIRRCLDIYFKQHENASRRSPWGMMHAMLPFGVEAEIYVNGQKTNAIGYLCWNGAGRGQRLFNLRRGRIQAPIGPGFQGHEGQFLAMLAQSKVKIDYPMKIGGKSFTVADLVAFEQRGCKSGMELTFKLMGLVHYLDSDATWKCQRGQTWSIPRLIREELKQPIIGAACGGTHRLMGFSYAVHKRRQRNEPIDGQWKRAEKYVNEFIDYTLRLQNPDFSFSTEWYEGRGNSPDIERRLQTTGHMLEWLVFSLPEERLADPKITGAVDYLVDLMLAHPDRKWAIGPKGHALRALVLYNTRVFNRKPGEGPLDFAEKPAESTTE